MNQVRVSTRGHTPSVRHTILHSSASRNTGLPDMCELKVVLFITSSKIWFSSFASLLVR